ncbi:MAG TPA: helix-turn-helix domain-containing protein [Longilinea sp.]|nr:helix-turn-helix domain-containing protein [Longilinea sp.]
MTYQIDFNYANSDQIEKAICERIKKTRLLRNWSRDRLAQESGVSSRTIARLEEGAGVTFDTIIRVMIAMRIQENLLVLFPDPSIRPIEMLEMKGKERKKASKRKEDDPAPWTWGPEGK